MLAGPQTCTPKSGLHADFREGLTWDAAPTASPCRYLPAHAEGEASWRPWTPCYSLPAVTVTTPTVTEQPAGQAEPVRGGAGVPKGAPGRQCPCFLPWTRGTEEARSRVPTADRNVRSLLKKGF